MIVMFEPGRATSADAAEISALTDSAYEKYVARIGRKPQPMTAHYDALIATDEVWVTRDPAGISGVLVLMPQSDHVLIYSIAVRPTLQRSGLGRRLLAHAESRCCHFRFNEVRLYTNQSMIENIAWYEREGYVETGRDGTSGFQRVNMVKRISCA